MTIPVPNLLLQVGRLTVIQLGDCGADILSNLTRDFGDIPVVKISDHGLSPLEDVISRERCQILILADSNSHECAIVCLAALEAGFAVFLSLRPDENTNRPNIARLMTAGVVPVTAQHCVLDLHYGSQNPVVDDLHG